MRCASSELAGEKVWPQDGQAAEEDMEAERRAPCDGVSGSGFREITGEGGCERGGEGA